MKYYTAAITLILVMDPLGNIPVFLAVLRNLDRQKQMRVILRECAIAFVILSIFLFFGRYILHGLHVTTAALNVAGGIILFLIAINMIFPHPSGRFSDETQEEPFIVPLAIPLTAGPSALATVMLFTTQNPGEMTQCFLALVIATVVFTVIMLSAPFWMKLLGRRGLTAVERLMGMILTTIAVQMFMTGVHEYLK